LVGQEFHVGNALCQGLEGDTAFQAGQGCTDAEVDAVSEGEVGIGLALHFKVACVRKMTLVTAARGGDDEEPGSFGHGLASHSYFLGCSAYEAHGGTTQAQDLFDG